MVIKVSKVMMVLKISKALKFMKLKSYLGNVYIQNTDHFSKSIFFGMRVRANSYQDY